MHYKSSPEYIKAFWKEQPRFANQKLTTETPNPLTTNLSTLCKTDLVTAFNLYQQIEINAINRIKQYIPQIKELSSIIQQVIQSKNKIYIIGCGASARLAILIKHLWNYYHPTLKEQLISVSAGGDIAMIHSVESFEDSTQYSILQLKQQGFSKNDLLIGISASGDSPFILSSLEFAQNNTFMPWLICSNPLKQLTLRNPNYFNKNIIKVLALDVGEMALTGSTRLQATTCMQIVLSLCITNINNFTVAIDDIINIIKKLTLNKISIITEEESQILSTHNKILYTSNNNLLGISILSDIVERSPTFNIPMINNDHENISSPFNFQLTSETNNLNAWEQILGHVPICLNWKNIPETYKDYLYSFNITNTVNNENHSVITWNLNQKNYTLDIQVNQKKCQFNVPQDLLQAAIVYKLILNSHSTLLFGKLGFFENNLMLNVTPSNFKLIDRAIYYCTIILKTKHNITATYQEIADILFEEIKLLQPNESIVMKVVNRIKN